MEDNGERRQRRKQARTALEKAVPEDSFHRHGVSRMTRAGALSYHSSASRDPLNTDPQSEPVPPPLKRALKETAANPT